MLTTALDLVETQALLDELGKRFRAILFVATLRKLCRGYPEVRQYIRGNREDLSLCRDVAMVTGLGGRNGK